MTRPIFTFLLLPLWCLPSLAAAQGNDLPARQSPGALAGRVLSTDGERPLAGAQILFVASGTRVLSDSNGRFHLGGVAAGRHRIRVRLLGYAPVDMEVRIAAGDTVEVDALLEPLAQRLSTVRVDSSIPEVHRRFMQEFEERRAFKTGGHFLDYEFLRKNDTRELEALLTSTIPGLKEERGIAVTRRNGGMKTICPVQVVINERFEYRGFGGGFAINSLRTQDLLAVEFHGPASTPLRYGGTSIGKEGGPQCGTLIFWTR